MSKAATSKKKHPRAEYRRMTSNVFSMFTQAQIHEFKEAFNFIDHNHDGEIDKEDLLDILISLGKSPNEADINKMLSDATGPVNFTMFLTIFGQKLNGTDPEEVVLQSFSLFDPENSGFILVEDMVKILKDQGDRWNDEMIDSLLNSSDSKKFIVSENGQKLFSYKEFVRALKYGTVFQ